MINWIKNNVDNGTATLTNNYLQTNKTFVDKFENCYQTIVGIDEKHNIVLKPISIDEEESMKYDDMLKAKVSIQKSFMRFGNTKLMTHIKNLLQFEIPKDGIKCVTNWDQKENALIINMEGEKQW